MPFPVAPEGQKYGDDMPTQPSTTATKASPEPDHAGLPVSGYTKQPTWKVETVNVNKLHEEQILRRLDGMANMEGIDKRWLAIGRTQIERRLHVLELHPELHHRESDLGLDTHDHGLRAAQARHVGDAP